MPGTSLEVQWLRLQASTAQDSNSIPEQGIKTPRAIQDSQKIKFKNIYIRKIFIKNKILKNK